MCSFQTVFSLILVFWSATYSGGSAVLNFWCKSVHEYNHEFTLQKHWHSSLKLCQSSDNIKVVSIVDVVNVIGVAI